MQHRTSRKELEQRLREAHQHIAKLENQLEVRTGRDPVSGLLDLHLFLARLDSEVGRARRHGRPLTVALLDVDHFGELNAHHGMAAGDRLLAEVGRVLQTFTRGHDLTARMSADEFVVLMPETDIEGGRRALDRIFLELEAIDTGDIQCVSASAGLAPLERGHSSAELLSSASRALRRARAAGGGRVETAGEVGSEFRAVESIVQRDAVGALAVTLLERDRYTGEHSESVVELAGRVARELGADPEEVERVRTAALLHDIGKVAIPDHILHKPGKLDEDEWALMREHPVIGERILRAIPGLGGAARIVRHEHERWDGRGYPDGLAGEEIPLGSRIILACDTYHAMTSDRPYRAAMTHAEAIEELSKCAGTQFDPEVTEVLIGCLYSLRQLAAPVH